MHAVDVLYYVIALAVIIVAVAVVIVAIVIGFLVLEIRLTLRTLRNTAFGMMGLKEIAKRFFWKKPS